MLIQTLGYAQWTLAEVAAHVRKADALLVDVRRQPYSSKSGFRKPDLQDELDDRYLHVPAFGNENFQHPDAPIEIRNVWRGIHRLQERAVPETIVLPGRHPTPLPTGQPPPGSPLRRLTTHAPAEGARSSEARVDAVGAKCYVTDRCMSFFHSMREPCFSAVSSFSSLSSALP
jgi:hypothetical protein